MRGYHVGATCAVALVFAVGCQVEGPTDVGQPGPSLARVGSGAGAGGAQQYLVLFQASSQITPDFEAQVTALGGWVEYSHAQTGFAGVGGMTDKAAATLARRRDVSDVAPDFAITLDDPADLESASATGVASSDDPTTAFFYARQWGLRAIGADLAWAAGYLGTPDITVAILDSGIDYTYPDLDGLVDLSRSVSFVPEDDALVDMYFPGKHYVTDLHYHGTHVASTVASHGGVVAGVTSKTTLIGVKVCNVNGSCPFSSVIAGILHAADAGADVANMSLGGGFAKSHGNGYFVGNFINRAMNYARVMGTLVVVASGNSAWDLDHNGNAFATYCDAPNVACVAATGPAAAATVSGPWTDVDTPAPYSNFGRSAISVAAPGGIAVGSGGFVWEACSQTSLVIPICQTGNFTLGLTGTSMASPHAAAVAALLIQKNGAMTPTALRSKLQQTADDLGQPGADPFYGMGRVNAATAVGAQYSPPDTLSVKTEWSRGAGHTVQ